MGGYPVRYPALPCYHYGPQWPAQWQGGCIYDVGQGMRYGGDMIDKRKGRDNSPPIIPFIICLLFI